MLNIGSATSTISCYLPWFRINLTNDFLRCIFLFYSFFFADLEDKNQCDSFGNGICDDVLNIIGIYDDGVS